MNHFVTPIFLPADTELHCIDPSKNRTDVVIAGDAFHVSGDTWMIYETPTLTPPSPIPPDDDARSARSYGGYIEFGVGCGVTAVNLTLEGQLETKQNNFDRLRIFLNGGIVHEEDSVQVLYPEGVGTYDEGDGTWTKPYETVPNTVTTFTINCSEQICGGGNVIRINANTNDEVANNHVYWKVTITSIT